MLLLSRGPPGLLLIVQNHNIMDFKSTEKFDKPYGAKTMPTMPSKLYRTKKRQRCPYFKLPTTPQPHLAPAAAFPSMAQGAWAPRGLPQGLPRVRPDTRGTFVSTAALQARGHNFWEASNRGHFYAWASFSIEPRGPGTMLQACHLAVAT